MAGFETTIIVSLVFCGNRPPRFVVHTFGTTVIGRLRFRGNRSPRGVLGIQKLAPMVIFMVSPFPRGLVTTDSLVQQ